MNRIPLLEKMLNTTKKWDDNLIHGAKFGLLNNVKDAIENGANLEHKDVLERTPFIYALAYGYTEIADYLAHEGADINAIDDSGENGLSLAVYWGRMDAIKKYYDSINKIVENGNTILHKAVYGGHIQAIKFVLSKNRDYINAQNDEGNTPLYYAVLNDDQKVIKLLIENGADTTIRNKYGKTPLEVAVGLKKNKSIKLLDL